MNVVVGRYKTSAWTFIPNTKLITLYNIFDSTDLSALNVITIQRATIPPATIGTPTTGGSVTVGTHSYVITMITPYGESFQGVASSTITVSSGNQTVPLSNIPIGNLNVTARNIYRTNAGGTLYYLIGTINDNVTTTFINFLKENHEVFSFVDEFQTKINFFG